MDLVRGSVERISRWISESAREMMVASEEGSERRDLMRSSRERWKREDAIEEAVERTEVVEVQVEEEDGDAMAMAGWRGQSGLDLGLSVSGAFDGIAFCRAICDPL
jgi:hypothetical protein